MGSSQQSHIVIPGILLLLFSVFRGFYYTSPLFASQAHSAKSSTLKGKYLLPEANSFCLE